MRTTALRSRTPFVDGAGGAQLALLRCWRRRGSLHQPPPVSVLYCVAGRVMRLQHMRKLRIAQRVHESVRT